MPRLPGVKLIPAPNDGFVRWSEMEERFMQLEKKIMLKVRTLEQRLLSEDPGVNNKLESNGSDNKPLTLAGVKAELMQELELLQSMSSSVDAPAPKEQKRVSYNDLAGGDGNVNELLQQALLDTGDVAADAWGFRGTCFDAAAFILDKRMMRLPESIIVTFLCLLSVVTQGLFILIVFLSLSSSPLDQDAIDGFHLWRTNVGHNVLFTNPLTQESLASRVCRFDTSLHISDRQVVQIGEIDDYLDNNAPFNGPMMCLLAMLTWTLTVAKEFHVLKDMWIALLSIMRGEETVFDLVRGNKMQLRQIRTMRLVWILGLSIIRVLIAGFLHVAGMMFLARTYSIEDILLNAVALEFVLNVDELLYQALAPVKTKKLLLMMRGIPLKRKKCILGGVDIDVGFTFVFSFGMLGLFLGLRLKPEMDKMSEVKDEVCGGFRDFSYGSTKFLLTLWASESDGASSIDDRIDKLYTTGRYRVIRSAIEKGGSEAEWKADRLLENHRGVSLTGPGLSVENIPTQDVDWFGGILNPWCADKFVPGASSLTDPAYEIALTTLRDLTGNQTVMLCTDVEHYCQDYEVPGPLVRMLCPALCGCTLPGGPLALPLPSDGCPDTCATTVDYQYQQTNRLCAQPSKEALTSDPLWQQFSLNFVTATKGWGEQRSMYFALGAQSALTRGCDAITNPIFPFVGTDLCLPFTTKNLAYWCPLSCGCNTSRGDRASCPPACVIGAPVGLDNQVPSDLVPGGQSSLGTFQQSNSTP